MIINMFRIYKLYCEIMSIIILLKFTSGYGCEDCDYLKSRKYEIQSYKVNMYK